MYVHRKFIKKILNGTKYNEIIDKMKIIIIIDLKNTFIKKLVK